MKNISQYVSFGLLLILSAFALGYTLPKAKEQLNIDNRTKIVRTRTRTRSRTRTDAEGTTSPGVSRSRFYISERKRYRVKSNQGTCGARG